MPGMTLTSRWTALLAVACLALVGVGAYLLGVHNTEQANWHTVTVDLSAVGADPVGPHRLLSIKDDGWVYAIEDSVTWIDATGSLHETGWPACLEPAHPGFSRRSQKEVRFRFAEVSTNTGYVDWRPVILVDCQSANA